MLLATRGQPEDLVSVAPHLVSFGLAKAASLHSKGEWRAALFPFVSPETVFRGKVSFSNTPTLTAAPHHRESGTVGVPGWCFTPPMGFPTNRAGGRLPGAAGALLTAGSGGVRLHAAHGSIPQRLGATQKSHGTTMTNVNYTTYLPDTLLHTDTQTHTTSWWMWTAEPLIY